MPDLMTKTRTATPFIRTYGKYTYAIYPVQVAGETWFAEITDRLGQLLGATKVVATKADALKGAETWIQERWN